MNTSPGTGQQVGKVLTSGIANRQVVIGSVDTSNYVTRFPHLDFSRLPSGYLDEQVAYAALYDRLGQLEEQFQHLESFFPRCIDRIVRLYSDMGPRSFEFVIYRDPSCYGAPLLVGGVIFWPFEHTWGIHT